MPFLISGTITIVIPQIGHHQVKEEKPGPCPICGMTMVIVPDINDW